MLDFESFLQYVKDNIKDYLPSEFADANVELQVVEKNNGKQLHSLTILVSDNPVSPNIYLDQYYKHYVEQGMDIDVIMERVAQIEREQMTPPKEITDVIHKLRDKDFVESHVIVAVVNAEKNAAMLKKVPHRMVEDLAVIYKLYLGSAMNSISTITVRNDFLKRWGITPDELHEHAMKNSNKLMPARVRDMESILRAGFGDLESLDLDPLGGINTMYVITNAQKVDGAASIIYSDALERTAEMVGTDLYILPSSIHETIAISADCCGTPEELAEMVKEINTYQVDQEEQLSDHVYKYDAQTKTLSLADVSVEDLKISRVSENKMSYEAESTEPVRPRHHR